MKNEEEWKIIEKELEKVPKSLEESQFIPVSDRELNPFRL